MLDTGSQKCTFVIVDMSIRLFLIVVDEIVVFRNSDDGSAAIQV